VLICEELGVESCDGTGWFRGTERSPQTLGLISWMERRVSSFPPALL
jgi:hypothetical protein